MMIKKAEKQQEYVWSGLQRGVYFVQQGDDGPIKIGRSANVAKRVGNLAVATPLPLRVLAVVPGAHAEERAFHYRFLRHSISGEWFRPSPDLMALVARAARGDDVVAETMRFMGTDPGGAQRPAVLTAYDEQLDLLFVHREGSTIFSCRPSEHDGGLILHFDARRNVVGAQIAGTSRRSRRDEWDAHPERPAMSMDVVAAIDVWCGHMACEGPAVRAGGRVDPEAELAMLELLAQGVELLAAAGGAS